MPKNRTSIGVPFSDEPEEQENAGNTSAVSAATEEGASSPSRKIEEVDSPQSPSPPHGLQAGRAPQMCQVKTDDLAEIMPVIPRSPIPPASYVVSPTDQL